MKKIVLIMAAMVASAAAQAGTAYYTGEKITGSTKQCYYDYLGSEYVVTKRSHELCPLSIRV